MRLRLTLSKNHFVIPMSYGSIIQGLIYNLMSQDEKGKFYHDVGYSNGKKNFKLFVFSNIFGKYEIKDGKMIFDDKFYFYISSQDYEFIELIYKFLLINKFLIINNQKVEVKKIETLDIDYFKGIRNIKIQTLSPIVAYQKIDDFTTYYKPSDEQFKLIVLQNLIDKGKAYKYPIDNIDFDLIDVEKEKMRIVKFKNTNFAAYTSVMTIRVNFETMNLLYNTGMDRKDQLAVE